MAIVAVRHKASRFHRYSAELRADYSRTQQRMLTAQ